MNDDGLSLSGWLFADMVLVLALVFLAIVPGAKPVPHPPTVIPTVVDGGRCVPQSNFQFDQIVVGDVRIGQVTWERIAAGRVRLSLTKAEESGELAANAEYSPLSAGRYLAQRQSDGYRIALTETFGWVSADSRSTDLAKQVNAELRRGIEAGREPGLSRAVFLRPDDPPERWSINYLDGTINPNSARINVFLVRDLPEDCLRR